MKYISLNWTLALKFSIGKKKRMRDCRILMAHYCIPTHRYLYKHIQYTVHYTHKYILNIHIIYSIYAYNMHTLTHTHTYIYIYIYRNSETSGYPTRCFMQLVQSSVVNP